MNIFDNIQDLTLDFYNNDIKSVRAKQYDANSRFINISFTNRGVPVSIDSSKYTCNIKMLAPDNRTIDVESNINEDGTVMFGLDENMLYAAGTANVEVIFYEAKENFVLSTMTFRLVIEPSVFSDDDFKATNDYSALTKMTIDLANELAETRELCEQAQNNANQVAEDTELVVQKADEVSKNTTTVVESTAKAVESANKASESEKNAKASETNAKQSEVNASASEKNAKESETNASKSAETATQKAEEATTSATQALEAAEELEDKLDKMENDDLFVRVDTEQTITGLKTINLSSNSPLMTDEEFSSLWEEIMLEA